jgi:hypothetical protein
MNTSIKYKPGYVREDGMVFSNYLSKGKEYWVTPPKFAAKKEAHRKRSKANYDANPIYSIWKDMNRRCKSNKCRDYECYGKRGITVCFRWESYDNFLADMSNGYQRGLQLDRKDNDGNYCPENCRWVTASQNNQNRRDSIFTDEIVPEILNLRNVDSLTWMAIAKHYGALNESVPRLFIKRWKERHNQIIFHDRTKDSTRVLPT